jgi:hypothetical protein
MSEISIELIVKLLMAGSLKESDARERAPLILEDFEWIDFDSLKLSARPFPVDNNNLDIAFVIPEYSFGPTGFTIESAEQATEIRAEWMGGTGLDRGHLQLFSIVSVIARRLIPHYWHMPCKLRESLRNPTQHLNTIEEIWWLDRWKNPQNIRSSQKLIQGSNRDVDWTFNLGIETISVNFEVKRLVGDCLRHVRGRSFKADWLAEFCNKKVIPKFRPSEEHEVNVLGISLFGKISREVQLAIGEWLIGQAHIDAVIISSRESRKSSCFDWHFRNPKAQGLRQFLNGPTAEDQGLVFGLVVPIDIPGFPNIAKA